MHSGEGGTPLCYQLQHYVMCKEFTVTGPFHCLVFLSSVLLRLLTTPYTYTYVLTETSPLSLSLINMHMYCMCTYMYVQYVYRTVFCVIKEN